MLGGSEEVNAEVILALFAKATDRPQLLVEHIKDEDGKVVGKRAREPDLAWMKELIALLWGQDKNLDFEDMLADASDQVAQPRRIVIPKVDERLQGRKRPRKAHEEGRGGDVPQGTAD